MMTLSFALALLAAATPAPAQQAAPAPTPSSAATPAPASVAPAPAPAASDPAAIIDREFPSYDRNADGALDRAEFSTWMGKLKTIADPTLRPDAPSLQTWLGAAFAQADTDKSLGVSKVELTGFLLPGRLAAR